MGERSDRARGRVSAPPSLPATRVGERSQLPGQAGKAGRSVPHVPTVLVGADDPPASLIAGLSWQGWRLIHAGLIALVGILVYANSLWNGFHLDDFYRVVDNPGIQKVWPVWRHFIDPHTMATLDRITQYRPLLPLTLSFNYALHGNSLPGYHLVNLLGQIVASLLVYGLVLELLTHWTGQRLADARRHFLALVVALAFAVHPVSGILVNYISGRDLLLMQVFLGASLLAYLHLRRQGSSWQRWALVLGLFELSMLSKTNPVVVPFLIVAFEVTVARERPLSFRPWLRAAPFVAVIGLHFLYTTFYLRFSDLANVVDMRGGSIWSYPLTQADLHLFRYLRNVFWPFPIRQQPQIELAQGLFEPRVLLGLAFIIASLGVAWRLRRSCRSASWPTGCSCSRSRPSSHSSSRPWTTGPTPQARFFSSSWPWCWSEP
jgi:protein O-mannosyl-transferase